MKIEATFVTSAASAADCPRDGSAEIALVGRSNVGKSSLINALVRQRIARTSAAPGKTRLANIYRVARGGAPPLYLVDLPGYGYARGGRDAAREFDALTRDVFGRDGRDRRQSEALPVGIAAILLVDSRHPGLSSDVGAWGWLQTTVESRVIVATKIDKLARTERQRACRQLEAVFEHPVLPVSAVTGEGLDELWILIDKLANNSRNRKPPRSSLLRSSSPPRETAPRHRRPPKK